MNSKHGDGFKKANARCLVGAVVYLPRSLGILDTWVLKYSITISEDKQVLCC